MFQANAIGRSAKTVREFLKKHYSEEVANSEKETVKLALKALLEVVQSGSKNMEIAIMKNQQPLQVCHIYLPIRLFFCNPSLPTAQRDCKHLLRFLAFRCHKNNFKFRVQNKIIKTLRQGCILTCSDACSATCPLLLSSCPGCSGNA